MQQQDARTGRRTRHLWATGLLIAVAGLFVLSRFLPEGSFWVGLLRAGAEAALVGGLADWFAVVALFRRPLGLPIPHTGVIPNNKDRIGDSLGVFVERNFLDPDLIGDRLREAAPSRRLAGWMQRPQNAEWLAERLATAVPFVLQATRDRDLRSFLGAAFERQLGRLDLAGLLSRALRLLRDSDQHNALFDEILARARGYLDENRELVLRTVEEKTAWWVPRRVDRKVAAALTDGLIELLGDLHDHDHKLRRDFDRSVLDLIGRLAQDPATRARVDAAKQAWLSLPQFEAYLGEFLDRLQAAVERDLERPDSQVREALAQALTSLGAALGRDPEVCRRLDERVVATAKALVLPWRHEIGRFIAGVVKGWDSKTIADRLEEAVGRDLQYIRINGTLVGALVGCVLYLISHHLFP